MKKIMALACVLGALAFAAAPAWAQQTTGTIAGRIVDAQGAVVPGATVTGKNVQTGFTRSEVTDGSGSYRLAALPVGTYDLTAELQGFTRVENKGIVVNVGQTLDVAMTLKLATVSETITVTGGTPLIETSSSSVGGVVDIGRIENLPLNGRQFANLAATIPGVGLGYHSDPTKSTQYSPQIGGGNGRNLNYQIDGGDNNDDTVGGLLQLFPLEAIQEFNFVTSRYKAEYGRSNGGVMNIVTKSGTNSPRGSWFTLMRDTAMNAKTQTEKDSDSEKQDYSRWQYGGSFGGPIVKDKIHYFGAFERTQQDTFQVVDTLGLFPSEDGTFATPYRETLLTVKGTMNLNASNYLSVRYGRNENSQPYGASPTIPVSGWGLSGNYVQFLQREPQLGPGRIEAERDRFSIRRLQQRHQRQQHRPDAELPEQRFRGTERQHPSGDPAEEMAVPRRLLVAHGRHGRRGPRHEGRLQLHSRAHALHHVQHRDERLHLQPPRRHHQRAALDRHPQRWRGGSQYPAQSVRVLRPGRLAGEQPADPEPRLAV